jgi:hypothetical protein
MMHGLKFAAAACFLSLALSAGSLGALPVGAKAGDTIGGMENPEGEGATWTGFAAGIEAVYARNMFADGSPAYGLPVPGSATGYGASWLKPVSFHGWGSFRHLSERLDVVARVSAHSDGKYGAFIADIPGGRSSMYFTLDEGGIGTRAGPLSLKAGRLRHYDIVDTPYSLVVNSRGIAAPLVNLAYDDGLFFYETRWVELNRGSNQATEAWKATDSWKGGFPDRGVSLKVYGLKFRLKDEGLLRFGYQDISVYSRRSFDLEYFLNPIPTNFTQYVKYMFGRPWSDGNNDNTVLGFFADYVRPGKYSLLGQFLLDDAGLGYFVPGWSMNPWQMALSLGGRLETKAGSFGLYAAGATKFTFEPNQTGEDNASLAGDAYGYTYYPDTRFYDLLDGAPDPVYSALSTEDNMIGYKYGENNLALKADWKKNFGATSLGAGLEFRLSGANSLTNPWHDYRSQIDGTYWLDDAVLEKRFMFDLSLSRRLGNFTLYGILDAGLAIDAFRLSAPVKPAGVSDADWATWSTVDRYSYIYRPTAGIVDPILRVKIGLSYELGLRPAAR